MSSEQNNTDYYEETIRKASESQSEKKQEDETKKKIFLAVKKYETDIIESKNERISMLKKVALAGWAGVVLLGFGIAGLTPLKTVEPFMLRVDNTTGYVDIIEPYNTSEETVNEAAIRYFLAKFVKNREEYEWNTIQTMYDNVESFSDHAVFDEYRNYMLSDYSPVKKLAKSLQMKVKVNSITFLNNDTAQVRFTKRIAEKNGDRAQGYKDSKWQATLKFGFDKNIRTQEQRLVNPLGMNIITYNVDSEVVK